MSGIHLKCVFKFMPSNLHLLKLFDPYVFLYTQPKYLVCRFNHYPVNFFCSEKKPLPSIPPTQIKKAVETIVKVLPKSKKKFIDYTQTFTDRNFLTAIRAMSEYLLKPSDLDDLPVFLRRSPYEYRKINVYLRSDIEKKALKVWGSQENLIKEIMRRRETYHKFDYYQYTSISKGVKKYMSMMGLKSGKINTSGISHPPRSLLPIASSLSDNASGQHTGPSSIHSHETSRIIWTAVTINFFNFIGKTAVYLYTGSHSMFSEAIHSLADTLNQLILAFGIKASDKKADSSHPYGYMNMRYVSSLISGVGIFFFGCGLSIYHGVTAIFMPNTVESLYWIFVILACSLASEGATLILSTNSVRRNAHKQGLTFSEYVISGQDPSVNVLLLEDLAAVLGVGIASTCLSLSYYLSNPIYDAIGSLSIGLLLGTVASFIIYTNTAALVGKSIPPVMQQQICKELENDVMIRAVHDVKATNMGGNMVKFKAEVDFDGREITLAYLDSQDLFALLKEMQNVKGTNEVEAFMLKHGESIVDLLGAEIDRIEQALKKKHPEMRHVDLEVL